MEPKNAGGRNNVNVTSTDHTFSTSGAHDFEHRLAGEESIKKSLCRDNVTITRLGTIANRNTMVAPFIPRAVFPLLDSVPRSYYLGHHAAGLAKMRTMLSQIDLIIECRDYRVPLTSHNPLFEDALAGRERMVVYTKKDLGRKGNGSEEDIKVRLLRRVGI